MSEAVNNGTKIYALLVEYNARTGQPTGRTKPNVPSDPNYIAPSTDYEACPLPDDPVIPTIDITVVIESGYVLTIRLIYGASNVARTTAGTWTVTDRVYDGVLFEVTTAPTPYRLRVEYGSGLYKEYSNTGVANTFIPGPFEDITKISITTNVGDFNDDWNNDYLN